MRNLTFCTIILAALLLAECGEKPVQPSFSEEEALAFLYQYMPLGDSVDYTEDYYRECVQYAFKAKEELPWGASIPAREFKHFVLPPRVNNENLDKFRATYYEELKARVQDLTLYDAVLEVNHWCHERVNYKGSDSRTSAPMATIKTSWGRCGEESTLLVTALRTVGIPARQVYTPRWAHCDDNHAWVEAWVDGQWHFLGACEPEPVLDLGWFNEPASRALLLHTRVFGNYDGPEEVISRNPYYTEINVVDNYGQTARTTFTVVDAEGTPQPGIQVEFKIYNYAEFCTVVRKTTDEHGQTWLTAGLGCMMAYAAKDGRFGFQVFKSGEQEHVTITLDHQEGEEMAFDYDMIPPAPSALSPEVTPEMRAANDRRIALEDSLRNAYIASCQQAQCKLIMNTGNKTLCRIYEKSWGNYQTIADFVSYAQDQKQEVKAVNLLQAVSDKDLRDISLEVLKDHFDHTPGLEQSVISIPPELYRDYILSPRISNEMIVPYRQAFSSFFSQEEARQFHDKPSMLVDWVKQNIHVDDALNPQRIPISPLGVLKARQADRHSRNIFFVAMARSLCIAAQINPVNGNVQCFCDDQWTNVDFEAQEPVNTAMGYLDLRYDNPIASIKGPKYYTHFSLKKFDGHSFRLLAYDAQDPGIDDGMTLSSFAHPLPLEEGYYILTTGNRLSDGSALTHSVLFNIQAGKTTPVTMTFRQEQATAQNATTINLPSHYLDAENGVECVMPQATATQVLIIGLLDQGSEPTTHAMQDIAAFKEAFEAHQPTMLFLFESQEVYGQFKLKHFDALPSQVQYGILDKTRMDEILSQINGENSPWPVFMAINGNQELVYENKGYTIGLGDQILKTLIVP